MNKKGMPWYYLMITIAIFSWGLSVTFIELGLQYISPLPFLAYRFILATAILTPFILKYRREEFVELISFRWTWIIGVSESIGLSTQYLGQELGVSSGLSALLSLCFLLIVPFIAPFILNQSVQKHDFVAAAIGFVGIIFITPEGNIQHIFGADTSILGILLLLMAAFSYAVYIVSTSRLTRVEMEEVDTFTLFYTVLLIVAISTSLFTITFDRFTAIAKPAWTWILLLTLFSTLIAFIAYFEALKGISATTASVLLLFQVVVPFSIEYFIFRRVYSIYIGFGIVLILVAMAITTALNRE